MNVLGNLSPLGVGGFDPKSKTGIFRVVEEWAKGLAHSPECEVYFHALSDLHPVAQFFDEHLRGASSHLAAGAGRRKFSLHLDGLYTAVAASTHRRAWPLRIVRRTAMAYKSAWDRVLSRVDARLCERMDIYHSPFLPVPRWVRRWPRMRRFTTVYDLIAVTHPEYFGAPTVRLLHEIVAGLDEEDHVTCISEFTRETLLAHSRCTPERVFVTPLAAGSQFYPVRHPESLAGMRTRYGIGARPYLLSVCTLEPRKNLDRVVNGFVEVAQAQRLDDLCLVLVGKQGWATEKIRAALDRADTLTPGRVLLTGFVPDEDLAALYSDARAFLYLSRLEGFGLPPLEAMQCGTPVITSNTSSLPEVVGDAGILLNPDDGDGLRDAMLSLVTDEVRREDLSARALARAALFTWERFTRQTVDAYRLAVSRS